MRAVYRNATRRTTVTLENRRVRVAHPTKENNRAKGVIGTAYPAGKEEQWMSMYVLAPEDSEDSFKVEDLVFSRAELDTLQ